jgi:hypothetical protein
MMIISTFISSLAAQSFLRGTILRGTIGSATGQRQLRYRSAPRTIISAPPTLKVLLINVGTGLPLHVDGNGDKHASVRWDMRDIWFRDVWSKFRIVNTGDNDGSKFLINVGTGLPLHVDGNGDKRASVRWGNIRDAWSKFRIVNTGDNDGSKFLINVGTGLPLHVDGNGDKHASVRWGNIRDAWSKFKITQPPTPPHPCGFHHKLYGYVECWAEW